MPTASAKLLIISGDKLMTEFMQCADVFEKSKVLGTVKYIDVSYKKGEIASLERVSLLIDAIEKVLIESKKIVSFIHVVEIKNGNVVIKNTGEITPYINKDVRCISDGYKWGLLSDLIESTGLKVITDEHKFIVSAGIFI